MYNIQSTLDSVAYELRIAPWKIENSTIDNQGKNSNKKTFFFRINYLIYLMIAVIFNPVQILKFWYHINFRNIEGFSHKLIQITLTCMFGAIIEHFTT